MMRKIGKSRWAYFTTAVLVVAVAQWTQRTAAREGSVTRHVTAEEANVLDARRLREGSLITDQSGFFQEDGEGATFVSDSGREFGALQNLNLERITRQLKSAEQPSSIRWSVTGQVTEFSGRNFLLISRAVYKSATPPPVPMQVTPSE